ncbi:hypothetical protein Patl1_29936 [Pistacia atlantica]|uniref:Uncharacterized protein n=1 Tax=Pistacia atlantica TaxID=434234 RepID=A0ACC1AD92_9ROSI|nr:hypothetical protein Patl1_29936 [Pistacia atlantica]
MVMGGGDAFCCDNGGIMCLGGVVGLFSDSGGRSFGQCAVENCICKWKIVCRWKVRTMCGGFVLLELRGRWFLTVVKQ